MKASLFIVSIFAITGTMYAADKVTLHDLVRQDKVGQFKSLAAQINVQDKLGRTPIYYASSERAVKKLEQYGAEINNMVDHNLQTPLDFMLSQARKDSLMWTVIGYMRKQGACIAG